MTLIQFFPCGPEVSADTCRENAAVIVGHLAVTRSLVRGCATLTGEPRPNPSTRRTTQTCPEGHPPGAATRARSVEAGQKKSEPLKPPAPPPESVECSSTLRTFVHNVANRQRHPRHFDRRQGEPRRIDEGHRYGHAGDRRGARATRGSDPRAGQDLRGRPALPLHIQVEAPRVALTAARFSRRPIRSLACTAVSQVHRAKAFQPGILARSAGVVRRRPRGRACGSQGRQGHPGVNADMEPRESRGENGRQVGG